MTNNPTFTKEQLDKIYTLFMEKSINDCEDFQESNETRAYLKSNEDFIGIVMEHVKLTSKEDIRNLLGSMFSLGYIYCRCEAEILKEENAKATIQ